MWNSKGGQTLMKIPDLKVPEMLKMVKQWISEHPWTSKDGKIEYPCMTKACLLCPYVNLQVKQKCETMMRNCKTKYKKQT